MSERQKQPTHKADGENNRDGKAASGAAAAGVVLCTMQCYSELSLRIHYSMAMRVILSWKQVESTLVELSAFRDKHEVVVQTLEGTVYKLELENRQLERQLMILTNSDMKKVDASENRLVKLINEKCQPAEDGADGPPGARSWLAVHFPSNKMQDLIRGALTNKMQDETPNMQKLATNKRSQSYSSSY